MPAPSMNAPGHYYNAPAHRIDIQESNVLEGFKTKVNVAKKEYEVDLLDIYSRGELATFTINGEIVKGSEGSFYRLVDGSIFIIRQLELKNLPDLPYPFATFYLINCK